MKRSLLFLLAAAPAALFAQVAEVTSNIQVPEDTPTGIDITVSAEPNYVSWSELSTDTNKPTHSYFVQRGDITLKIKEEPWTFGMRLTHLSLNGVSSLPKPLRQIPTRYPLPGSGVFVSQASLSYVGFAYGRPFSFDAGIIPIHFGKGLILSDNDLGIFGFHGNMENTGPVDVEFYSGNTESSSGSTEKETFYMGNISAERMGKWKLGYMVETDPTIRPMLKGTTYGNSHRNSTLIYYNNKLSNFTFDLEGVFSRGAYFLNGTGNRIASESSAFALEGGWATHIPRMEKALGELDFTFLYAQGSGDKASSEKDEAYFAPLTKRFDGANRTGWGELLGTSAYDALPSTTTWNGMPIGLSGISTIGLGLKTGEYRVFSIPMRFTFDRYIYRAAQSNGGQPKNLGGEFDFGALIQTHERFKARLVYYMFDADEAYNINGQGISSITGFKASFALSFE